MTMSVGDLLDDWFEYDAFKGAMASSGVVGVWAGPRTPGTAYNLLHHELGEIDGVTGLWGHVQGRHGRDLDGDRAQRRGRRARRSAPARRCESIDVSGGRTVGVTLDTGEEIFAPVVVSGAHPKTTVLDMVGAEHFPADVVEDMRRYKTRGGSVKVNWVLSEPPRYEGVSRRGPEPARAVAAWRSARRSTSSSARGRTPAAACRPRSRTSRSRRRRRSTRR